MVSCSIVFSVGMHKKTYLYTHNYTESHCQFITNGKESTISKEKVPETFSTESKCCCHLCKLSPGPTIKISNSLRSSWMQAGPPSLNIPYTLPSITSHPSQNLNLHFLYLPDIFGFLHCLSYRPPHSNITSAYLNNSLTESTVCAAFNGDVLKK